MLGMLAKRKAMTFCLALVAMVLVFTTNAAAQASGSGTIQGRVTDQTGAIVPGAKVSVRSIDTNITRHIETDEQGHYRVTLLPSGPYEVIAQSSGFSTVKRPEIRLEVGSTATVNFELKVSATESTITVTDTAPVTEPERTEVTSVVSQKQVEELPINGRRWDNFVLLTPAVSQDGTFGLISARGISGLLNNNTVDGVDNNQAFFSEARGRTRVSYTYSQSAIKEFQVGLSTFSAEFGRAAGSTINAVTKSGTNVWHGEAFYYIRDDKLQAREPTLFDPRVPNNALALKNKDRRQQYGLTVGGPIIKDKLFFFGNWDQLHRTESYLATPSGGTFFTTFMADCQTVTGGVVPTPPLANCTALFNYFQSVSGLFPRKSINNVAIGKVDWNLSQNHVLTGSYNWHRWRSPSGIQTQQTLSRSGSDNGLDGVKTDSIVVKLSSVLSARMVNEAKFQYGRDFEFQLPNSLDPRTTISNGVSFGMSEFLPRPAWPDERRFQWVDTLSWTIGRHTLKTGMDINYVREQNTNVRNGGGQFDYFDVSASATVAPNPIIAAHTFRAVAGLALDCPPGAVPFGCVQVADAGVVNRTGKHWSGFTQAFDLRGLAGSLFFTTTDYNFFVQDTFKWTPRITINAGVRYELQHMPKILPVTIAGVTTLGYPGQSFSPETQKFNQDTNNWGPRLAFAWDVRGNNKDVVRMGGGIYYGRTGNAIIRSALLENGVLLPSFGLSYSSLGPATNPAYPTLLATAPTTAGVRSLNFLADDYVRPFIMMTDVAFEHELWRNSSVSVTYMFTRANHLQHSNDINLNAATTTANIVFDADGSSTTTTDRTTIGTVPFYAGSRPFCDTLVNPQSATCAVPPLLVGTRLRRVLRQVSDTNSTYQGLIFQFTQRARWGMTQTAHLTISTAKDEGQAMGASPFAGSFEDFFDPMNRFREYERSDFDVRKRFVWNFIWQPSDVWKAEGRTLRWLFGDWSLNGIVTAQGGQPFNANVSGSISSGTGASETGSINGSGGSLRLGWLPRNFLDTTGMFLIDFRAQKEIRVTEGMRIRFMWQAFNLFNRQNHPNRFNFSATSMRVLASSTVGGPSTNLTLPREVVLRLDSNYNGVFDPLTGQGDISRCTKANCLSSSSGKLFGARDMEFGLRFIF